MSNVKIKQNGKWIPASIVDVEGIAMAGYQYSEDEQVVGCWTDGRPIYRKSYQFSNVQFAKGTWTKLLQDSSISVDNTIRCYGIGNAYSYYAMCPFAMYHNNSDNYWYYHCTVDYEVSKLVVEYTKTTDAENSFTLDMLTTTVEDTEASDEDVEEIFS